MNHSSLSAGTRLGHVRQYMGSMKTGAQLLRRAAHDLVRDEWLGQLFPPKPRVLQLPITRACNSHCIMCGMWRQKRRREISADDLRRILLDPLFSEVRYVGINGGEPTLRPDLPAIGVVLADSLPKLSGFGMITNAVRPAQVMQQALALERIAAAKGLAFDVSVSLDGIGEDHDRNRGVQGNFGSAIQVIDGLRERGVSVSVGCTLTPLNCYGADDVLLWCESHSILRWEFRLAVEIERLHNKDCGLQAFSPEQQFHLAMFFAKLAARHDVNRRHRRFYGSLSDQLALGTPRRSGCDWRLHGITLDAQGNVSYCSARSPVLGSALNKSASALFREGLPERKRIARDFCDTCQHDLLGPEAPKDMYGQAVDLIWGPWKRRLRRLSRQDTSFAVPAPIKAAAFDEPSKWRHVLITGWYGTETAGDKAILAELLRFLHTHAPGCTVTITTLDRKVSQQTALELVDLQGVKVLRIEDAWHPAVIEMADAVIIGGGPLEEIRYTEHIWRMFVEANRQRKARIIFGSGIGPLYTDHMRELVSGICQMATAGFVRDEESRQYASRLGASIPLGCGCDPALAYVARWAASHGRKIAEEVTRPSILSLARANTTEYVADARGLALQRLNRQLAQQMASILGSLVETRDATVRLLPMHTVWVGGDDRVFNRDIAAFLGHHDSVYLERAYLTLPRLLEMLYEGDAAVVMRYHAHLFCLALGIPFVSIDYTGHRGKVRSLISRIGYEQWCETWDRIDAGRASSRLAEALDEREYWSRYLQDQTSILVAGLHRVYSEVFGVVEDPLPGRFSPNVHAQQSI